MRLDCEWKKKIWSVARSKVYQKMFVLLANSFIIVFARVWRWQNTERRAQLVLAEHLKENSLKVFKLEG